MSQSAAPDKQLLEAVARYADELVLKHPNLDFLNSHLDKRSSLIQSLQTQLKASHRRGKLILPRLSAFNNQTVAIFSDYAGEGSGSFRTYSFLVCAWNCAGLFLTPMKKVRADTGLGDKEIAFKDFRYGPILRALPDYLRLADNLLPGFLFTLVVDKKLESFFGANERATKRAVSEALNEGNYGHWTSDVAEKVTRVTQVGALLTALLAKADQKIFWMTDDDAICANEELHKGCLALFQNLIRSYPGWESIKPEGGSPFKERHLDTLDLLSLADVVSSSVEHYLSRYGADATVKNGADQVLRWLGHDGVSLKKMIVIARPNGETIQTTTLEFALTEPPEGVTYIPVVI